MCGSIGNVIDHPLVQILWEYLGIPNTFTSGSQLPNKFYPYYKPVPTAFKNTEGEMDAAQMNWGWVREWDKGKRLFNSRRISAKGQPIWDSKVWGKAIRNQRCLIPIPHFYEWNANQPKGKRDCYRVEHADGEAYILGGIYEINSDGEMFMSICTTDPNKKMEKIHHRMPVIIDKKDSEEWLVSDNQQDVDNLMSSAPDNWISLIKERKE